MTASAAAICYRFVTGALGWRADHSVAALSRMSHYRKCISRVSLHWLYGCLRCTSYELRCNNRGHASGADLTHSARQRRTFLQGIPKFFLRRTRP